MNLKNKTILITGGTSGIGLAAVPYFLNEGMKVIVCGRNERKNNEAQKMFPEITVLNCDITVENEVYVLYQLIKSIGSIDILYHNAATIHPHSLTGKDVYTKGLDEMNTNYLAVLRLNDYFMEMLMQRKEAAIIHTTSAVAYVPISFLATYSAGKAALHSYTQSLRHHLQNIQSSIRIFELMPPTVDTEPTKAFNTEKISPQKVVEVLIQSLRQNRFTIHVEKVKMLYFLHRLLPSKTFAILNKQL
jgi:uncharacterized oxidoreductase